MAGVGRLAEAVRFLDSAAANPAADINDAGFAWFYIQSLWAANRLVDADAAAQKNMSAFPRNIYVWSSQFALLLFTGRADQARKLAEDLDLRPVGVPDDDFERLALVASALTTNNKTDKDKAADALIAAAHTGAGYAENAVTLLPALGRIDDAFMVANGLYFDRGFAVGKLRFSAEQRIYTQLLDRKTRPLFLPPAKPMRRDPRFLTLVTELKIADYWQKTGTKPDYQKGGDG
jgi:hypothetical protein